MDAVEIFLRIQLNEYSRYFLRLTARQHYLNIQAYPSYPLWAFIIQLVSPF